MAETLRFISVYEPMTAHGGNRHFMAYFDTSWFGDISCQGMRQGQGQTGAVSKNQNYKE
jgi:hypothetical protein